MDRDKLEEIAAKVADKLMFITGINKPANRLTPSMVYANSVEEAGYYLNSEVKELVLSVLINEIEKPN